MIKFTSLLTTLFIKEVSREMFLCWVGGIAHKTEYSRSEIKAKIIELLDEGYTIDSQEDTSLGDFLTEAAKQSETNRMKKIMDEISSWLNGHKCVGFEAAKIPNRAKFLWKSKVNNFSLCGYSKIMYATIKDIGTFAVVSVQEQVEAK